MKPSPRSLSASLALTTLVALLLAPTDLSAQGKKSKRKSSKKAPVK